MKTIITAGYTSSGEATIGRTHGTGTSAPEAGEASPLPAVPHVTHLSISARRDGVGEVHACHLKLATDARVRIDRVELNF